MRDKIDVKSNETDTTVERVSVENVHKGGWMPTPRGYKI